MLRLDSAYERVGFLFSMFPLRSSRLATREREALVGNRAALVAEDSDTLEASAFEHTKYPNSRLYTIMLWFKVSLLLDCLKTQRDVFQKALFTQGS